MSFQKIYGLHGLNHQIIEYSKKEKVMTDKSTDRQTDRISSCRLDPFCRRGRVKINDVHLLVYQNRQKENRKYQPRQARWSKIWYFDGKFLNIRVLQVGLPGCEARYRRMDFLPTRPNCILAKALVSPLYFRFLFNVVIFGCRSYFMILSVVSVSLCSIIEYSVNIYRKHVGWKSN